MTYKYFVAYNHARGFGNHVLNLTGPITGMEEIRKMSEAILATDKALEWVAINNYILIEN